MKTHFIFFYFLLHHLSLIAQPLPVAPVDRHASSGTRSLYNYLLETQQGGRILFGHHDAMAYGHGWRSELGRSDVKDMTGSHPAVCSFDFGKIEHNAKNNINRIPFDEMRELIRYAYELGQIITLCWHVDNPKTYGIRTGRQAGSSWDNSDNTVVREILENGSELNLKFKGWLDNLAGYIKTLTDKNGEPIPFIFRPWHEHTQTWNWWGKSCATDEEFIGLWKFTLSYLLDAKGIHNMLYAISPQMDEVYPNTKERLLYRWPGDDLVDFIGMDCYHGRNKAAFMSNVKALSELVREKGKLGGITETGIESVNYPAYFTEEILPALEEGNLSLIVFWRNDSSSPTHHYLPYKGHAAETDFVQFTKSPIILLEKDMQAK